jgi:hypothetical protein
MQPNVDEHGIEAIVEGLRALSTRAYVLGPVGYKVRSRILESERRHLATTTFAPRKKSTLRRYRYPLANMADEQDHRSMGRGPLNRLGLLHRTLTKPQAPGQRDSIKQARGGLDVAFGVKARGPAAYIGMQAQGNGGRLRRDPFHFDEVAHGDATGDVLDHIVGQFGHES